MTSKTLKQGNILLVAAPVPSTSEGTPRSDLELELEDLIPGESYSEDSDLKDQLFEDLNQYFDTKTGTGAK